LFLLTPSEGTDMAEVKRDRWGRPLIVPPNGGKPVAYTRATTIAGSLDDGTALIAWKMRMACIGLSQRQDLLVAVAATDKDDTKELNALVEEAMEAAGANAAARIGSAVHSLTEVIDRGEELGVVPEVYMQDLQAYAHKTLELKNIFIEQFCVLDEYKIAGTPDRVVEYKGERYICDLKTGSLHATSFAMQLSIYAHAAPYDLDTAQRGTWGPINKEKAIVVHLPAGKAQCELHWVDIAKGWEGVKIAMQARQWRDQKNFLTPFSKENNE
jgi:PD-(D/E)XK nuclease superfamily